jgi:restriction system protein
MVGDSPPLQLDPAWCPAWYLAKFGATGLTVLERDLQRRSRLEEKSREVRAAVLSKRDAFLDVQAAVTKEMPRLRRGYAAKEPGSLARLIEVSNGRHPLPDFLRLGFHVRLDETAKVTLIEFDFPDYARVALKIGRLKNGDPKYASASQKKKLVRQCLYSLVVRAGYLAARILDGTACQTIAINVRQSWFDPATGAPRNGIICTIQAGVADFLSLSPDTLDPEVCFRHLKGIAIPSFDAISPVRPIFVLNKTDDRFVDRKLVDAGLEPEANLAAMPWEDFEHLVAQLFEWEFAKQGVEVRVTRASRDRGVDAILFDPDPLRGGKFVLQAKRYTRPVDVAAVRDLYGTVMNEGANRGILITTSSYGPDSYEFAKDKPISLVDGPNLLLMLQRHGKRYRIDLEEARKLQVAEGGYV